MAVLGQILTIPEPGWRRIDDNDSRINYTLANLTAYSGGTSYYNNTIHFNWSESTGKIKFRFFGSKLRLICSNATYTFGQHTITIDGITENIYKMGATTIYQFLAYEKTGLPETSHDVEITLNGGNFGLDAIDVDSVNGGLTVPIGSVLTTPDTGWQRFDDNDNKINYINFNGKNYTQSGNYGTGLSYSTSADASIIIKFYGTKFRYITQLNTVVSGRTPSVDIIVDGVTHTITTHLGSATNIVLAFEKLNLSPGIHTVVIKRTGTDSGNFVLDALDIDSDGYLIAQVGQALTAPETGWKRIDDSDGKFQYIGIGWNTTTNSVYYNSTRHNSINTSLTDKVKFKFKGTKLRIISSVYPTYSPEVTISIDGVVEKASISFADNNQIIIYEKTGLSDDIHEVIYSKSSAGTNNPDFTFDAIDIDDIGYLIAQPGVGMQLTAPEPGWKRIDDTDTRISLTDLSGQYTGKGRVNGSAYNSTDTQFTSGKAVFKFKGTKLRITGMISTVGAGGYSNDVSIKIDSLPIEKFSNGGTAKYQVLLYEKTGLDNIIHTVEISNNLSGAYVNIDALDIDGDMAGIGVTLPTPEPGWRRIDDNDNKIIYTGAGWQYANNATSGMYYLDTRHYTSTSSDYVTFKFYGTKLRIINPTFTDKASDAKIQIDGGTPETLSFYSSANINQCLIYENLNLNPGVHEVKLMGGLTLTYKLLLDAIDTDGYLVHPILNQVSKIEDMKIGDCIPVRYKASTSGAVGAFSEIGTSVVPEIPYASSATPDGMFYFIKVAKGLLIADRVIQNSIAWDTLNSGKLIEGGAEALIGTVKYRIRSISGGVGGIDANKAYSSSIQNLGAYPENNEWDKYISNSNLENKITAGDDKIWHWNIGTASWVRETPVLNFLGNAVATGRITRGKYTYSGTNYGTDAKYISWQGSNNVGTLAGFRPALEFLEADAKAQNIYY